MKIYKNENGSLLVWAALFLAVIGTAVFLVPNIINQVRERSIDDEYLIEAQMLAEDIKEIGKYLMFYEKGFFIDDNPLKFSDELIKKLWGNVATGNEQDFYHICGGPSGIPGRVVTAPGSPPQILSWDMAFSTGQKGFCTMYYRSNILSGNMYEKMVAPLLTQSNVILTEQSAGVFAFEVDLKDVFQKDNENFVRMNLGQKILDKNLIEEAKLKFKFFTDSSGFTQMLSERYMQITGSVRVSGQSRSSSTQASETIMMVLSTPKDFAWFIPYPSKANGEATRLYSESLDLSALSSKPEINVFGRVFFNGDIDVEIDDLPTFHDLVIISGDLVPPSGDFGVDFLKVRDKFKKGIVTHFNAERFVLDHRSPSITAGGDTVAVINGSQFLDDVTVGDRSMNCKNPDGSALSSASSYICRYIVNLNNPCFNSQVTISGSPVISQIKVNPNPTGLPIDSYTCEEGYTLYSGSAANPFAIITGGYTGIDVKSGYVFTASPTKIFTVSSTLSHVNVYGLLFTGNLKAVGNAVKAIDFYSLPNLKEGLIGIATKPQLESVNLNFSAAYEGVSVPLINMPVVYSAKESGR